jgi:hypothetical protein
MIGPSSSHLTCPRLTPEEQAEADKVWAEAAHVGRPAFHKKMWDDLVFCEWMAWNFYHGMVEIRPRWWIKDNLKELRRGT